MKLGHVGLVARTTLVMLLAFPTGIASAQGDGAVIAFADLHDADGAAVGRVDWTGTDAGVIVDVKVNGLPPGFHGFHVHAVGECVAPFTSAGGHLDPDGASHPDHVGDMPVLLVNADGTGEARFVTDRYTVNDLFGAAVIIHADPDNYANIPDRYSAPAPAPSASPAGDEGPAMVSGPDATTLASGDAGPRIACGMVAVPKPAASTISPTIREIEMVTVQELIGEFANIPDLKEETDAALAPDGPLQGNEVYAWYPSSLDGVRR